MPSMKKNTSAGRTARAFTGASDTCSVPGCGRPAHAKGLCQMHYDRTRKRGGILRQAALRREPPPSPPKMFIRAASRKACCVPGCTSAHHAKGYCKSHYSQLRRRGDIAGSSRTPTCEIAGCNRPVSEAKRCETHLKVLSLPGAPLRLTTAQRLGEIKRRHEAMRSEIERIKKSFDDDEE